MSDNVTADPGTGGAVFATDDIGGVQHPRTKIGIGADGSYADVSAANPLPVSDNSTTLSVDDGAGSLTVDGTVAATQSGAWNVGALTSITNVVHVDDNSSSLTVDDGAGSLTVDGTVAATQSGTWTVQPGNTPNTTAWKTDGSAVTQPVSAASLPLPSGASTAAKQPALGTAGTASADVLSVQGIASMTALKVDGSGVTQPVSGTVTATVGTVTAVTAITNALPAGNNNIGDVDVASIAAGDNNIGNVDIVTVPTDPFGANADAASATGSISAKLRSIAAVGIPVTGTVTVGAHAVTNAGTFVTQVDGSALTALQLIDDPVIADDAAFTPATSKVMMAGFEADEASTDSVDEGDAGAARMTLDRKQIVTLQPHTAGGLTLHSRISVGTSGDATNVKSSAGQLYEILCTNINAAPCYLKFYDSASAPTAGSGTPVWRCMIPGNSTGAGLAKTIPNGLLFASGIGFTVVTGAADNSSTSVAANECLINLGFK